MIEVSKITISIGKKDIELTLEEARELRDALVNAIESNSKPQYTWNTSTGIITTTKP